MREISQSVTSESVERQLVGLGKKGARDLKWFRTQTKIVGLLSYLTTRLARAQLGPS
jgi:hypothetical protein